MNTKTEEVWDSFSQRLSKFINLRVANKTDAEDLLQEIFIKIHKNLDSLDDDQKLAGWIFKITRNTITDYYRKKGARKSMEFSDYLELPDSEADDELKQIKYCLNCFRNFLPEKYRVVIELADFQRVKQKDIADQFKISLPAVKSRIRRARKMIRQHFTECCKFQFDQKGNFIKGNLADIHCTLCHNI